MTWALHRTNQNREWVMVGTCESLSEAAARIIEIEQMPVKGLFFELHVSTLGGDDGEFLGHLEFTGKGALYVVKRSVQ
jgi:hypothetical protein